MAPRTERKLAGSGSRFVLIGVAIAVLGTIPIAVGAVLLLSAGVERRSREDKPWA